MMIDNSFDSAVYVGRDCAKARVELKTTEGKYVSRLHAVFRSTSDGTLILTDLRSNNGTYVCHDGEPMRRLEPDQEWVVLDKDQICFGLAVFRSNGRSVNSPFLFEFISHNAEEQQAEAQAEGDADESVLEVMSSHLNCAICHDLMVNPHSLQCGHIYCGTCITAWTRTSCTCPVCRKTIATALVPCRQLNDVMNALQQMRVNPRRSGSPVSNSAQ